MSYFFTTKEILSLSKDSVLSSILSPPKSGSSGKISLPVRQFGVIEGCYHLGQKAGTQAHAATYIYEFG
jgi:hypothetical protein